MAFVVRTKGQRFEVRESRTTSAGPRSRTLCSFTEWDEEALARAQRRAEGPLDAEQLREAASRAGAPIAAEPVDRAVRETLRLIAAGDRPDPMLRRLLLDALRGQEREHPQPEPAPRVSDAARAATAWIGSSLVDRGEALRDLLLLGDALPSPARPADIEFPRLRSDAA